MPSRFTEGRAIRNTAGVVSRMPAVLSIGLAAGVAVSLIGRATMPIEPDGRARGSQLHYPRTVIRGTPPPRRMPLEAAYQQDHDDPRGCGGHLDGRRGPGECRLRVGDDGPDLTGSNRADRIYAKGGDDQVSARSGADLVAGRPGNRPRGRRTRPRPRPRRRGRRPDQRRRRRPRAARRPLHGNAGNDRIYGNRGFELITGNAGDDELRRRLRLRRHLRRTRQRPRVRRRGDRTSSAASATGCTAARERPVIGGAGRDKMSGGTGDDTQYGGAGAT